MSKHRLDEILAREINKTKTSTSIEDATAMLMEKSKPIIPKPAKKSASKKRAKGNSKGIIDGNEVLKQIKADRKKTPENSGTITSNGKVLASAKGSEPSEADSLAKEIPLTVQESFLNQIEQYK